MEHLPIKMVNVLKNTYRTEIIDINDLTDTQIGTRRTALHFKETKEEDNSFFFFVDKLEQLNNKLIIYSTVVVL